MKSVLPVFLLGLLSVPFLFNSCQGGFKAQSSLSSSLSPSSCKVTIENGEMSKLTHSYKSQPDVFKDSKLLLGLNSSEQRLQKSGGQDVVPQGSSLTAIYDNLCLRNVVDTKFKILWDLISPNRDIEPVAELVRQAYTINLDRDYEVSELQSLTDSDSCVVGVSWNSIYEAQAFNDPENYQQGHFNSMNANQAFDLAFGQDLSQAQAKGASVKVAVIDSGVDWQHPDLQSNFWVHSQGWGVDATTINSSLVNYNPFDVSSNGHGTHIAGLIGAVSNNSLGIVGTLPFNAKIMAIKIFKLNSSNELVTNSTHLYNGLQFAILNGAEVMNLSLMATGSSYDAVLDTAITDALQRGVTVVAAMGNGSPGKLVDGTNFSVVPAVFATRNGVMAVGSYDSMTGQKSDFSHYSTTYAEVSAPGAEQGISQGVFSTLPTAKGSYGRLAGTSQSTAIVSGAAALSVSLIKKAYGATPSPYEVERLIVESSKKNANLNSYFKDGNQLDLQALVNKIHTDYPLTKTGGSTNPVNCR